jgi:hypothetical protein
MKKVLLFLLSLCSFYVPAFAQPQNYSGYSDTAIVTGFKGTGSGVTKAMNLSQFENIRFTAMANDTVHPGYASDSIIFIWGIQLGNFVMNSSGKLDTTWQGKIFIDSFNIIPAGNKVIPVHIPDSTGAYGDDARYIDTINVTGYAVQDRNFSPAWAPLFRFWYLGISVNQNTTYVKLRFAFNRRVAVYVHAQ